MLERERPLFILGNGFDIDLGLPTSYESFFHSEQFPFVKNDHTCHNLGHFVYNAGVLEKWYDLENILAGFGKRTEGGPSEHYAGDESDYKSLINGLIQYLREIDFSVLRRDSVAARLLKAANGINVLPKVYTFNYTRYDIISSALDLLYNDANHIHGSIASGHIVLGVGEYVKLPSAVSFLLKTSAEGYDSRGILTALEEYNDVIVFGLSLSQVDYPYFEDFFRDVAERKYVGNRKKYIRIFTYDERSRMEILDNLRRMNSGMIKLMGYSDFDIIRVKDGIDEDKVMAVINRLHSKW